MVRTCSLFTGCVLVAGCLYAHTYFDKEYPWSIYVLSCDIEIYGKYLYKNTMGSVDILEIPCPSEVPEGRVGVRR